MAKSNRFWILGFIIVTLVCIAAYLVIFLVSGESNSRRVGIYQNNELVETVDLSQVTEPYEITLTGDGKENIVRIDESGVYMLSANCPDQLCVNQGHLNRYGTPIVCLPNKVVLRWVSNGDEEAGIDAQTGW